MWTGCDFLSVIYLHLSIIISVSEESEHGAFKPGVAGGDGTDL